MQSIKKNALKFPFSKLMEEVEVELNKIGIPFDLLDEIKSINAVRNCLVHRNGIVSNEDVKDAPDKILRLKYRELIFMAESMANGSM